MLCGSFVHLLVWLIERRSLEEAATLVFLFVCSRSRLPALPSDDDGDAELQFHGPSGRGGLFHGHEVGRTPTGTSRRTRSLFSSVFACFLRQNVAAVAVGVPEISAFLSFAASCGLE